MKLIYVIVCLTIFGFSFINYEPKYSTAEVEQIEGIYIFTDCKPINEYIYMGTVKGPSVSAGSSQYTNVRDNLIRRAKKEYPTAQGLIFTFVTGGIDKCDAIKFK